jgi:hypothetical protein
LRGSEPGSAGADGGSECDVVYDRVQIDVTPLAGVGDAGPPPGSHTDVTFDGVVLNVARDAFDVDTCPPTADCAPGTQKHVTISAPDLELRNTNLQVHPLVRVHFARSCPWGCVDDIIVQGLTAWGGSTDGTVYVVADDGGGSLPEAPYTVTPVRLSCPDPFQGGCGGNEPTGVYAMSFHQNNGLPDVVVNMGHGAVIESAAGPLLVRNLRSYITGYCDDGWNWAHWAVPSFATRD